MRTAPLMLCLALVLVPPVFSQETALYEELLSGRGITQQLIRTAFLSVSRDAFVDGGMERYLGRDAEIPLTAGGFLIRPSMALSCLLYLSPLPAERCLIAGSYTGYMASLLASICKEVYVIEEHEELIEPYREIITSFAAGEAVVDGRSALEEILESGGFDIIMIHGATQTVSEDLLDACDPGGRLLAPMKEPGGFQILIRATKTADGSFRFRALRDCLFPEIEGSIP